MEVIRMSRLDLNTARCEALFASPLQRSQAPPPAEVQRAVRSAIRALGSRGCACCVAQEFGDHPDAALARMRWAREMIELAFTTATVGPGCRAVERFARAA
jgi:hypothetical protein